MKKLLIIPVMVLLCFSCTNNKPLTDKEKEEIISQVKQVNDSANMVASKADFKSLRENYDWNDPDYILAINGKTFDYEQMISLPQGGMQNQELTIIDEDFNVLDRNIVLYTSHQTWLMKFSDGREILQNPFLIQTIYKKAEGKWKAISVNEIAQNRTKKSPTDKTLDQKKLANQFAGKWSCSFNDTTVLVDQKPFGLYYQEGTFKITSNGKTVDEGKAFTYYSDVYDKLFVAQGAKLYSGVYALAFTDNNHYTWVNNEDLFHPETAIRSGIGEFKSADEYVESAVVNGKVTSTYTYKRIR